MRLCVGVTLGLTALVSPSNSYAAQLLSVPQIQGEGHNSPHEGDVVQTSGTVTLLVGNNFYIQGEPDGNSLTSDGILVRSSRRLDVSPGDIVAVEGIVEESSSRYPYLSTTVISDSVLRNKTEGTDLPAAVVIGEGGLVPPTETAFVASSSFDPTVAGADFYETLEGTLVSIAKPIVVGPASADDRATFYVVADRGEHATGMNSLGGITITPGDANPERIKVQVNEGDTPGLQVSVGDTFESVSGVVTYDGNGAYGIALSAFAGCSHVALVAPTVTAAADGQLDLASYNVENLDPKVEDLNKVSAKSEIDDDVGNGKFTGIAGHIVGVLKSPVIVALQEVQDNDGAEYSDVTAGDQTLAKLIAAVESANGPTYQGLELTPPDDEVGGQPGGNIHAAFLFDPSRITPLTDRVTLIQSPAYEGSRLPLAVPFQFNGRVIWVIDVHLSSKGGSDPLYGTVQPPRDPSAQRRVAQARAVRDFIRGLPADDRVVVVGDFNAYWFEEPLLLLTGGSPALTNLALADTAEERISYVFDGNSQSLDHVLTRLHADDQAILSTPHVNSIVPVSKRMSDHDPKHVVITFGD